jgi:hypothetical protein
VTKRPLWKTYFADQGHWTNGDFDVWVQEKDGTRRRLDPRLDLANHSPTGFAWGYPGSGPAQLALALAADVTGHDERAVALHQRLKAKVVQHLDQTKGFTLTEGDLWLAIHQIEFAQREAAKHPTNGDLA